MTGSLTPRRSWLGHLPGLRAFARVHEWYPGKVPSIVAAAALAALVAPERQRLLPAIATVYALSVAYLAFGYMLNNVADHEADLQAGKPMALPTWSRTRKALATAAVGAAGLGAALVLLPLPTGAAVALCYLLAWTYSMPPRWKEHVVLGPLVGAFAQAPAPALVAALALGGHSAGVGLYIAAIGLYGLRMMLVHQVLDHDNDRRSGTRTTARVLGLARTRQLVKGVLALELAALGACLVSLPIAGLPALSLAALAWPAAVAGVRLLRGERPTPYAYSWIPLASLQESVIPLIIAATLALDAPADGVIVCLLVALLFASRHVEHLVIPLLPQRGSHG